MKLVMVILDLIPKCDISAEVHHKLRVSFNNQHVISRLKLTAKLIFALILIGGLRTSMSGVCGKGVYPTEIFFFLLYLTKK